MNLALLVVALAARTVFSFADPAIDESSGLVDLGDVMVTTNDSGDEAVLYVVDSRTGRTVGHTRYGGDVSDVEALAPGRAGRVWVGDIGDNRAQRPFVTVYDVPVGRGERTVAAASYRLAYPKGPRDAESLFVHGGRLHVISKGVFGGQVFRAPARLSPDRVNVLRPVGRVGLFATDAARFRDGRHLLVRGYGTAEVLTLPGFRSVASFDLPSQEQGEAVSIGPGGRIRLSSEGAGSPVLQVRLPADVRALLAPPPGSAPVVGSPEESDAEDEGSELPLLAGLGLALVVVLSAGFVVRRRRR